MLEGREGEPISHVGQGLVLDGEERKQLSVTRTE